MGKVDDVETQCLDFNCCFLSRVHDTDSFALSLNTKNKKKDLKNFEDLFDFSNLSESYESFSDKKRKLVGKKNPRKIWVLKFFCLSSKNMHLLLEMKVKTK